MLKPLPFEALESREPDGSLRVALIGELDLAVADQLSRRLEQLISAGIRVRLDLSQLDFIDSSGIRTLVRAAQHGRASGLPPLEVGHEITRGVRTVIDLLGVATVLWPTERSIR